MRAALKARVTRALARLSAAWRMARIGFRNSANVDESAFLRWNAAEQRWERPSFHPTNAAQEVD